MQDSAKGREVISDNMMEKIEPDVKDLENGVVSNVYLKERYRNCVQYHDQKFDISEAAHVLERNTEMMHFVQDAYMQEFGESLPDFDEMDNRLLENIGVIESNINIAERSASLNELKETVNQLRDISENRNNRVSYEDQLKIDTAKDAVEKYEEAVKLSDEMQKLLAQITVSRRSVQMHHLVLRLGIPFPLHVLSLPRLHMEGHLHLHPTLLLLSYTLPSRLAILRKKLRV